MMTTEEAMKMYLQDPEGKGQEVVEQLNSIPTMTVEEKYGLSTRECFQASREYKHNYRPTKPTQKPLSKRLENKGQNNN